MAELAEATLDVSLSLEFPDGGGSEGRERDDDDRSVDPREQRLGRRSDAVAVGGATVGAHEDLVGVVFLDGGEQFFEGVAVA
ncbi:hypothetical protein ACFQH8_04310 [Halomicroarcula sp. GCM10025710]